MQSARDLASSLANPYFVSPLLEGLSLIPPGHPISIIYRPSIVIIQNNLFIEPFNELSIEPDYSLINSQNQEVYVYPNSLQVSNLTSFYYPEEKNNNNNCDTNQTQEQPFIQFIKK